MVYCYTLGKYGRIFRIVTNIFSISPLDTFVVPSTSHATIVEVTTGNRPLALRTYHIYSCLWGFLDILAESRTRCLAAPCIPSIYRRVPRHIRFAWALEE